MFISGVVTQPYSNSTERKQKVQILLFLCRLSDGCDHTTRYTLNSDLTALEEALKNVSVIESLVSETHIETLKTLRTTVKKQVSDCHIERDSEDLHVLISKKKLVHVLKSWE